MAAKAGKKGLRRAMIFAEICLISWRSGRRAAAHGRHTCHPCHLWLEVALRDVTVDRHTGAVERHGRIEYRVNALEFAARVVHALTQRLAIEFVSLCSVARPGRHWFRQRAEAGGARARRAWPRRRQSAMGTHRRARCPAPTLSSVVIRTTLSPTTSRESASPLRSRSWRLGPPPRRAPAGSRHAPTAARAARPEIARRRRSRRGGVGARPIASG